MKRHAKIAVIGWPLGFLVLTLFAAGDFSSVAGLLFMSIVCTAGVGLLLWFPFFWVTGKMTLWLLTAIGVKISDEYTGGSTEKLDELEVVADAPAVKTSMKPRVSSEVMALAKYIKKFQDDGATAVVIFKLKQAGWNDAIINQALELAKG